MKNIKLKPLNLLFNFIVLALIGIALVGATPTVLVASGILSLAIGTFLGFVPTAKGSFYMALQKEIWINTISKNLYRNNSFLALFRNRDEYVMEGKVLHIPQSGGQPIITKNRSLLPASVVNRVDTDLTVSMAEYTSDPFTIANAEIAELSYDKMESMLYDHLSAIKQTIADNALIDVAPTLLARITRTTVAGALVNSHIPGTTGTRRAFLGKDLKIAKIRLLKDNLPEGDLYALMSVDMFDQLVDSLSDNTQRDYLRSLNELEGTIPKLFGFNILVRAGNLVYNAAGSPVPNAYGQAVAISDNDAVLCFHKDFVFKAEGEIKLFTQQDSPQYYGDMASMLVRFIAGREYADQRGIVAIVQN